MADHYSESFMQELASTVHSVTVPQVGRLVEALVELRRVGGRLFVAGLGGSAANASHAACDLRNLASIDALSLVDSPATFSAAANDHGWEESLAHILRRSHTRDSDALLLMSVGGGSLGPPISVPLIRLQEEAKNRGMRTFAIVGPRGGIVAERSDVVVRVPVEKGRFETVHTEIVQSVIWHCIATHPELSVTLPLWEGLGRLDAGDVSSSHGNLT
jgi:D-sedoheptulose 7-phosphate isomerase